jgi:hypothetical protein
LPSSIEAKYFGLSAGRFYQAEQQPDGRRLAGAVGAKEAKHGSRWNLEREIVEGSNRPVAPRQPIRANCKF